ncbi:MAG: hypothetical protein AAFW75_18000 [Cyanobacteria bacterium J06636_16]
MTFLINFTAIAAVIYFGIAFVCFVSSNDSESAQAEAEVSQASPQDFGAASASTESSSIAIALHQSVDAGLLYRLGGNSNVFCTNRAWSALGATSRQQVLGLLWQIIDAIDYIPIDTLWLDEQQYLTCLGPFDRQGFPPVTLMTVGEWHQSLNARALPAGRFEAAA